MRSQLTLLVESCGWRHVVSMNDDLGHALLGMFLGVKLLVHFVELVFFLQVHAPRLSLVWRLHLRVTVLVIIHYTDH